MPLVGGEAVDRAPPRDPSGRPQHPFLAPRSHDRETGQVTFADTGPSLVQRSETDSIWASCPGPEVHRRPHISCLSSDRRVHDLVGQYWRDAQRASRFQFDSE